MKMYSLKDYILFVIAKVLGWFFRALPMELALSLARGLGTAGYYLDKKQRRKVYSNLKIAFGKTKSLDEINKITKKTFQNFSQNIAEVLCLPKISHGYIEKHVEFENRTLLTELLAKKKALIFSSMHFGNWELSFVLCDRLGPPFKIIAKEQEKYKKVDNLLNAYRQMRPDSVLYRGDNPREMIRIIKNNEILGIVIDQGGKDGRLVDFFGRRASMPTGALRLALKYNVDLVLTFIVRQNGPFHKIILKKLDIEKTGDIEKDIDINLKKISRITEGIIAQYPEQYMWFYRVWKYSDERKITILNDGKTGHLRQAQGLARILGDELKSHNLKPQIETIDIKFKNSLSKPFLALCSLPAKKRHCQGCLWCLRRFLDKTSYETLSRIKTDFVISCGSSLANLNYIISNDNVAKSISILRPNLLSAEKFDLVVMPKHDNPPKKENIAITNGSLNLIDEDYLSEQINGLILKYPSLKDFRKNYIGVLLGGDTKKYKMSFDAARDLILELKKISEKLDLRILLTTSRRTPQKIEELIKENLKDFPKTSLLIIANEHNIPEAVGGILGLSKIVITSDDSISMVSEAASSGRHVIVAKTSKSEAIKTHKHKVFLNNLKQKGHIFLTETKNISACVEDILGKNPKVNKLDDNQIIKTAIGKIL